MTIKQIQARLSPLDRKIARLKQELDAARARQKQLKTDLSEAKKNEKASPKAKKPSARKTTARRTTKKRS